MPDRMRLVAIVQAMGPFPDTHTLHTKSIHRAGASPGAVPLVEGRWNETGAVAVSSFGMYRNPLVCLGRMHIPSLGLWFYFKLSAYKISSMCKIDFRLLRLFHKALLLLCQLFSI